MAQYFRLEVLSVATGGFSEDARIPRCSDREGNSNVYRGGLRVGHGDASRDADVAVRELSCGHSNSQYAVQILAELDALDGVRHANILEILGYAYQSQSGTQPRAFLVYPFVPGGTLTGWLCAVGGVDERPNAEWRLRVSLGVASALTALHTNGVVHGDVTSRNILIDADGSPILRDGGGARRMHETETHATGSKRKRGVGAQSYMDPECADTPGRLKVAGDVFSLGVVMLELLTGKHVGEVWLSLERGTTEERLNTAASLADEGAWRQSGTSGAMRSFAGLAITCTSDTSAQRPTAAALTETLQRIHLETVAGYAAGEEKCVVCLNVRRAVRFGCGHLVACETCAQTLHSRGDPCPYCRQVLDSAGFVNVSPEAHEATYLEVEAAPPPPLSTCDADVLRLWRDRCPELRRMWPVNAAVRTWEGVTFGSWLGAAGRVIKIDLGHEDLTGELPSELGRLTALNSLSLEYNSLTGGLPVTLGQLTALEHLDLRNNNLSGTLPPELGLLSALQHLQLGENQFSGALPTELGRLTALYALEIEDNQFTGVLPVELGQLTGLDFLSLEGNQLSGTIPVELGNLTALTNLNLRGNLLTGVVPAALGQLVKLSELSLNYNQLSGTLPPELGLLTRLEVILLDNNQFSGALPAEFGRLTLLHALYLEHNRLTGTIPAELGLLTNLTVLYLDNNQFSGAVPMELGKFNGIGEFTLGGNPLLTCMFSGALAAVS
jgi:hypothetical protein